MTSEGKIEIGPLSPPPSAYTESVVVEHRGGDLELRARYERDGGLVSGGLRLRRVRGYRFRAEGHCTAWHIDGPYDTLVEVVDSTWVAELRSAEPSGPSWDWPIRHFLIFIDSAGAYEVAAESAAWLPETRAR